MIILSIIVLYVICINYIFIEVIHIFYNSFDSTYVINRANELELSNLSITIISRNISVLLENLLNLIIFCDNAFFAYGFIIFFLMFTFIFIYILDKKNLIN